MNLYVLIVQACIALVLFILDIAVEFHLRSFHGAVTGVIHARNEYMGFIVALFIGSVYTKKLINYKKTKKQKRR